jgi:predicted nucleic acid-binding protein
MRLLLDTNIFLEVILDQEKANEAKEILANSNKQECFISDYSLHSIGLLLFRKKMYDVFREFIKDMITNAGIMIAAIYSNETESVINAAKKFNLDFDDAYQYAVSEKYDLTIISFDSDFDKTERGRKTPIEINQPVVDTGKCSPTEM